MNLNSKISIAVARFFRRYGRLIIIILTIWVIIIIINTYLKKNRKCETNNRHIF